MATASGKPGAVNTSAVVCIEKKNSISRLERGRSFSELIENKVYLSAGFFNTTEDQIVLKNTCIKIVRTSDTDRSVVALIRLRKKITVPGHQEYSLQKFPVFAIMPGTKPGVYDIYICSKDGQGKMQDIYLSFFRVLADGQLATYNIRKEIYQGLDIFKLRGGMSAEYAVEKSLASISGGISHTWSLAKQGGVEPVFGNPDFLEKSVHRTVELYNKEFGVNAKFKTVIISTGMPNVPYLSHAMKAPVLPLHFLVSVNKTSEVQSILEYALAKGDPAYATLGYDTYMPAVAVAWIKLLDLPEEYRQFLTDHQVENVILLGDAQSTPGGEKYVRKTFWNERQRTNPDYSPGTLYILYPAGGIENDDRELANRLLDFGSLKLGEPGMIADWEGGICDDQVKNFSSSINRLKKMNTYLMAPDDMMVLYNSSACFTMELIKKNRSLYGNDPVKGVVFNEYLISHPSYEAFKGDLSLLYWQFTSVASHMERLFGFVQDMLSIYYPGNRISALKAVLNSNFNRQVIKEQLAKKGVKDITMNPVPEDVWDPADGMNKACELIAEEIVNRITPEKFRSRNDSLVPLDIADLENIQKNYPALKLLKK